MARRINKVKEWFFNGKLFAIIWGKIPDEYRGRGKNKGTYIIHGECDPPDLPLPELKINDAAGDEREIFMSSLHEATHAADFSLSERQVTNIEENVGPFLWEVWVKRKK